MHTKRFRRWHEIFCPGYDTTRDSTDSIVNDCRLGVVAGHRHRLLLDLSGEFQTIDVCCPINAVHRGRLGLHAVLRSAIVDAACPVKIASLRGSKKGSLIDKLVSNPLTCGVLAAVPPDA